MILLNVLSNFLGGSFFGNPVRAMYRLAPWLPVYKSDGVTYELGYNSGYNPVAVLETTKRNAKTYNISAVLSPTIRLAKGLTFEGNYALDFNHAFTSIFYDSRVGNANVAAGGVISNFSQDIVNWISDFTFMGFDRTDLDSDAVLIYSQVHRCHRRLLIHQHAAYVDETICL
jgi:hypothetical protein